jgi:hypothetical protein
MDELDLATLDGLSQAVEHRNPGGDGADELGEWRGTYCASCGATRRMKLFALFWHDRWTLGKVPQFPRGHIDAPPSEDPSPSMFLAVCLECRSRLTLVVHRGPDGPQLVALPQAYGGLSSPNTPTGVSYYLDQAERAKSVASLSAAVVMYRAALEQLLHEQGVKGGMLGNRLETLEKTDAPPWWRDQLDQAYLSVINKLGSAAIHVNHGDVGQQAVFDEQLLLEVRELFTELLDLVYERESQKASRLARLQEAASSIKR